MSKERFKFIVLGMDTFPDEAAVELDIFMAAHPGIDFSGHEVHHYPHEDGFARNDFQVGFLECKDCIPLDSHWPRPRCSCLFWDIENEEWGFW